MLAVVEGSHCKQWQSVWVCQWAMQLLLATVFKLYVEKKVGVGLSV